MFLSASLFALVCCCTFTSALAKAPNQPRPLKNMFIINEDNSRFLGSVSPDKLTVEELQKFVDSYATTKVTHMFFCPNAMRANFNTKVWTPVWAPWKGATPKGRWATNAEQLSDKGIDPYAVWLKRCREKGLGAWLSMRMNDLHNVDDFDNFQHSDFWRAHPEFWRVPNSSQNGASRALNFANPEVRDYTFAFISELFERYDFDGLELDWMRFPYHLTPDKQEQEAPLLTAFMKRVRQLSRQWEIKRGHTIYLGVRVPTHPDAAQGLGMDAVRWAKEGLVDLLVPSPFFSSSDYNIPVELWLERLGQAGGNVALAVAFEDGIMTGRYPRISTKTELSFLYGFISSARSRGCDNFYLFNWMYDFANVTYMEHYKKLLAQGISDEIIRHEKQTYPIAYRDTCPPEMSHDIQLPQIISRQPAQLVFRVGNFENNAKVQVLIGFDNRPSDHTSVWPLVTLNGQTATDVCEIEPNPARFSPYSKWVCKYSFNPGAIRRGAENHVEIMQNTGNVRNVKLSAVWAELTICP